MTDKSKQKGGIQFKPKVPACYSYPIVVVVVSVLRCPSTPQLVLTTDHQWHMVSLCLVPDVLAIVTVP